MIKRYLILICLTLSASLAHAQNSEQDSIPPLADNDLAIDTSIASIDYDELFSEFDLFMDSILAPRSYFLANLSVARGYFNYINKTTNRIDAVKKYVLSPGLGYYSKNGLGITATGNMVRNDRQLNLYQFSVSPSFDYLKNRKLAAGVSYMRYFTKDSLPFYLSPLENEVYGYFLWRKAWLQPGITASYGWGSRTDFRKREIIYKTLLATAVRNGTIRVIDTISILISNRQSVADFTLTGSLRHDFYWLGVFSGKDHIRLSPLLSLTAGTQKFGSNQATGNYSGITRASTLYNSLNRNISLVQQFKVLSLSLYLRSEYSIGKFFLQPQVIFDYYFPAGDDKMSTLFSLNTGFIF